MTAEKLDSLQAFRLYRHQVSHFSEGYEALYRTHRNEDFLHVPGSKEKLYFRDGTRGPTFRLHDPTSDEVVYQGRLATGSESLSKA